MNELVKRLYQTAMVQIIDYQTGGTIGSDLNVDYFAKLIVREIIELIESVDIDEYSGDHLKKNDLIAEIKQRFEI